LVVADGPITLAVEDNGRGFETDGTPAAGKDGLMNLRRRMEDIGGRFEHQSKPSQGTRVTFTAPLGGDSA